MTTPITVTFSKTKASPWLEAEIRDRVDRLKVLFSDILSCRVVVDIPHRRHQRGNRFAIRIELAVPGEDLAISRDSNMHGAVEDSRRGSMEQAVRRRGDAP
ncbi:MAG: HPF/RaiA family ribosome-associated protein [Vicinamibacterales bacterium]